MVSDTPSDNTPPPSTNADFAREYKRRGWKPIPLKHHDKAPESSGWQREDVPDDRIDDVFTEGKNIGLLLGPASGGLLDVDLDDQSAVLLARHFLKPTGTVCGRPSKPNSHFLYQTGGKETLRRTIFQDPDGTLLVEIRGEGHQTMVPGSIHPHGEKLEWSDFGDAATTTVEDLEKRAGWLASAAMLGRLWPELPHQRHDAMMHLAGGLLHAGESEDIVKGFGKAVCLVGGEDDWADREKAIDSTIERMNAGETFTGFPKLNELIGIQYVDRLIKWMKLAKSGKPQGQLTDTGNSERFVARNGQDLKHSGALGWSVWDGTRYRRDETGEVVERMTESVRSIFNEAKDESDPDKAKALAIHAAKSLNHQRIMAGIALARSKPEVAVRPDVFDRDPWAFNVPNGTINLMTGGLQPHNRADLITKLAPVPFEPDAEAPIFAAFLHRAMGGDPEAVAFLQRMAGYCLTGDVSEQVFFFLYGLGQNGKSKFIEALQMVMGDYSRKLPTGSLMKNKWGANPNAFAHLPGVRMAPTNETPEGGILDDSTIKDLTGGDRIAANFKYHELFEFDPTHKIVMYGNNKPKFRGTDKGIRRRPILIPFTVEIPDSEKDPHLADKFRRELPGILAWAVEGTLAWRREGLNVPASIRAATDEYIDEQDAIKRFLSECTVEGDRVLRDDLFAAYEAWARDNSEDLKTQRELMTDLGRRGYPQIKSNSALYRQGIRLIPEWERRVRTRNIRVVDGSEDDGKGASSA